MDGGDILKAVKNDENLKSIPVVVLTTSDDPKDIDYCYRNGANTYIKKPVDLDNFFEAIKSLDSYWFGIAILPDEHETTYSRD